MPGGAAPYDDWRGELGGLLFCHRICYDPIVDAHEHERTDVAERTLRVDALHETLVRCREVSAEEHGDLERFSRYDREVVGRKRRTLRVAENSIERPVVLHHLIQVVNRRRCPVRVCRRLIFPSRWVAHPQPIFGSLGEDQVKVPASKPSCKICHSRLEACCRPSAAMEAQDFLPRCGRRCRRGRWRRREERRRRRRRRRRR
mmetsp:Transcript_44321/g.128238  ORF Transcript_44321/g.128238 Transcript_44321/m.128238 type:complete len:202 (+) Transcript_44321:88-693(+)